VAVPSARCLSGRIPIRSAVPVGSCSSLTGHIQKIISVTKFGEFAAEIRIAESITPITRHGGWANIPAKSVDRVSTPAPAARSGTRVRNVKVIHRALHVVSPRDLWLCVLPRWQINVNV
jgi:hypothetical protein